MNSKISNHWFNEILPVNSFLKVAWICSLILLVQCSPADPVIEDNEPEEKEPEQVIVIKPENKFSVDVANKSHRIANGASGVVSCWLMDSDIERPRKTSFSNAMKEMGVKFIRFPYGHLADNYLWDADGDWGNDLTPKVAASTQIPASWDWAVDPSSGAFKEDMDFDEYISICNQVGAEPMVVVNILSYKYNEGPSYEYLKESAVEWVRYANILKGYGVKRWALGNEVDHHSDLISKQEYKALYTDFATAMKGVDPTIWIGPGLLGNWHADLLSHDPDNIDFICAHNYLYAYDWRNQDYLGWKTADDILVNNVEKCQKAVDNSTISDIEIHVTEMNSRPWSDKSDNDDLFRALAYGEMALNALSFENIKATYVWNTHGPWGGPDENTPYNVLDLDNNREPRGEVIKLLNDHLLERWIEVEVKSKLIRCYDTSDEEGEVLAVFLMNKNDKAENIELETFNGTFGNLCDKIEFYGDNPLDEHPELLLTENIAMEKDPFVLELKPLSLTIIQISKL